jgi:phosphoglycolate phosphatase-like HAD superfamily hydrolase
VPLPERMKSVAESDIDTVLARYLEMLRVECAERPFQPLPGVAALLGSLRQRSDVLLGLCTGNLETGAGIKLRSAGLWGAFRFGGYGSDAEPRADIVRVAWRRAKDLGATEALVVGDTPRDILAAREAGLPTCAVATGRFTVHELAEHGPAIVAADFSDAAAAERLLLAKLD